MRVAFPCDQMSRHKNTNNVSISSSGIKDPADKEAQFFCTRCRWRIKSQVSAGNKTPDIQPAVSRLTELPCDRLSMHSAPRRRMSATYGLTNSYIAARWRAVVNCRLHQLYFPAKWQGLQNKQRLFPYATLTDWFSHPRRSVFIAR